MPGVGLLGPDRVSLGENSRMLLGGPPGLNLLAQVLNGIIAPLANVQIIRFASGTLDARPDVIQVADNLSYGFSEKTRGSRNATINADCFFRAADNPFTILPGFSEGEECARVMVWPDVLNLPNNVWKFPIGFVEGYSIALQGTAEIRFSISLSNQKTYYSLSRPDPAGLWA